MSNAFHRSALRVPLLAALFVGLFAGAANAAKAYDAGADDKEVRIGNTVAYSGPLSIYGLIGRAESAYFKKINEEGGINGRMVKYLSYDDAYSPPKTLEQVRKLVESDEVLAIVGLLGSPTNAAVQKYLNQKKIPQLFAGTGAGRFNDPKNFPWTMGWMPSYRSEGALYARLALAANPAAKVGIVFQNDDFGKEYLAGVKDALAGKPNALVEAPFETTTPTIDSQVMSLRDAGVDTLVIAGVGKFASQAIRKAAELGWKPSRYVSNTATSVDSVLRPAGLDNATGIVSAAFSKEPSDPSWVADAGMKEYMTFMDKYMPGEPRNGQSAYGFLQAQAIAHVLRQCGDTLTRENVMKQASTMKNVRFGLLLPGVTLNTSPNNFSPIGQFWTQRFDGQHWKLFGDLVGSEK
jgi:branched-chain amino acid transport system substrate-binding protein